MKNPESFIFSTASKVTRTDRERLHQHGAALLWFTGLSGSGKTTLTQAVEEKLHQLNYSTMILDGDNVRTGLCNDLDFSAGGRSENIRRIGEVAKLFIDAGVFTLAAFIAPMQKDRDFVRSILGENDFFEIYCKCSLDMCETRDVKGIYKRARAGQIKNFTGIDSIYEKPVKPDLILDTEIETVQESLVKIFQFLRDKNILKNT